MIYDTSLLVASFQRCYIAHRAIFCSDQQAAGTIAGYIPYAYAWTTSALICSCGLCARALRMHQSHNENSCFSMRKLCKLQGSCLETSTTSSLCMASTLYDLERPLRILLHKTCIFRILSQSKIWMKIDHTVAEMGLFSDYRINMTAALRTVIATARFSCCSCSLSLGCIIRASSLR